MKTPLLLALAFAFAGLAQAQTTYLPVALTGFNADVVADGTGDAATVTTIGFDSADYNLVAEGYTNPLGETPTSWLPASGLITSVMPGTPGLTYQLAPYSGNNSMRISGNGIRTLDFVTPLAATEVYVLAASGSGSSDVTVLVDFADGSTENFFFNAADWFNAPDFAIQGISRVKRTTSVIENSVINPRLYQHALPISAANAAKPIVSITFTMLVSNSVLNVMGISVLATPTGTAADLAAVQPAAYPNPSAGNFSLRIPSPAGGHALLRLTDVTGRTVLTRPATLQPGDTWLPLNLSSQAPGLYLLAVETETGTTHLRLVKE